jgi:hypothetical protein
VRQSGVRQSSFMDYVNTDVQSRKMYAPILFQTPFLVLYKPLSIKGSNRAEHFAVEPLCYAGG